MLPFGEEESIFLTFPTIYSYSTDENGKLTEPGFVENEKRPLVVLLAWTSAIERHMRLYSKIYEDEGYITLISICPVMVAVWHHDKMREIAHKLVNVLEKNDLLDRPTIIQQFSNGGSMQYEFFMKYLKENHKFLNIKGVIFDSTPGRTTFKNYFTAIHIMRGGTSEIKSTLMTASVFAGWNVRNFIRNLTNREYFVWNPWNSLKNEENRWPQHFIYSKADLVTPYQEIEAFLNHRKQLGVKVTSIVYEGTPHIRHLQYEKQSYIKSVMIFVRECLNNSRVYEVKKGDEILKSKL